MTTTLRKATYAAHSSASVQLLALLEWGMRPLGQAFRMLDSQTAPSSAEFTQYLATVPHTSHVSFAPTTKHAT